MSDTLPPPASAQPDLSSTAPAAAISREQHLENVQCQFARIIANISEKKKKPLLDAVDELKKQATAYEQADNKKFSSIFWDRAETQLATALQNAGIDNAKEKAKMIAALYKDMVGYKQSPTTTLLSH